MYNKLFIPLQHSVGVVYFSIIMVVFFSITIYKRKQGFRGKNGYNTNSRGKLFEFRG